MMWTYTELKPKEMKRDTKATLNEIGFQNDNEMRCQSYTWSNETPKLRLKKQDSEATLNKMRCQSYT